MIIGCAAVVRASDNYIVLYGFSFTIDDNNEATIHEYDDRSAEVNIPNTLLGARVVCIDDYAFFGDTSITSLNLSSASYLDTIGVNAFYGCSSLTELTIPPSVELSYGSFNNCGGLETLVIENGATAIPAQCFYNCGSLNNITIPSSVTEIRELAFGNCPSIKGLVIPDTVQSISANAFDGCDDLVICCHTDSYAMFYAIDNGIEYVLTDQMIGDTDCNGSINVSDVTVIQKHVAKLIDFTAKQLILADTNGDGKVDITDATHLQKYLARYEGIVLGMS